MNVYWQSAIEPPKEAKFYLFPFLLHPCKAGFTRIFSLPNPQKIYPTSLEILPSKQEWRKNVEIALEKIAKKELQKVVLARKVSVFFPHNIDPFALSHAFRERGNCTLFCFAQENSAFLGLTPETLFSRRGNLLSTMAMAGTQTKETPFSWKEEKECLFVKQHLEQALHPYSLSFSPLKTYETKHLKHLVWECKAALHPNTSSFSLIQKLHPTPAVLGKPRENALSTLKALEPFSRGFYAGVVGWEAQALSDWKVAIRSCLLEKHQISFYTGVGIVAGSDPDLEWEELNLKMRTFEDLFATSLCLD